MKNNEYDVLIIGGGIVGTAIAREMSKYDLKTCLVEKEYELSFGVSKANSGIVHAGFHADPATLKGQLCARGNFLYGELQEDLGIPFKRIGELVIIYEQEEFELLEKMKEDGEKNFVPNIEILNQQQVREKEPNISPDVIGALYAPTAGVTNPYEFVYLLAENARRNGVEFKVKEEVLAINGNTVKTTNGEYKTKFIINAAGLYADRIANMAGMNDFEIHPRKGQEYLLDRKCEGIVNHIIFPLPGKTSKGTLIIPTLDGTVMVGPSAEETGDKKNLKTSDDIFWEIFTKAQNMIPSIQPRQLISAFAGARPAATGGDFFIGKTGVKGFINAAGIQSPGLTAAPAIAEKIAETLKEEGLELNKKADFKPSNPKVIKIRDLSDEELAELVKKDPDYGKIVCRCERVSEAEIRNAIKAGARTLDGIKFRTRAGMGRCQAGFCTFRTMEILAEELGVSPLEITKRGPGTEILVEDIERNYDK